MISVSSLIYRFEARSSHDGSAMVRCRQAGSDGLIEFVTSNGGAFVVVSYPRSERFDLPSIGCLYNTRLSRLVSVRCPRGASQTDLQCDLKVINERV